MCGICGFVRFKEPVDAQLLRNMTDSIRHRGPDDEGYFVKNASGEVCCHSGTDTIRELKNNNAHIDTAGKISVGMGFRRLSILDLSPAGHQPMADETKRFVITFNGEIYNYKELRKQLQEFGYHFKTGTDTEVILYGYAHWGKSLPDHLNGMYAFTIFDTQAQTLFLVRDRIGIKPFFYHRTEAGITWASEIKAILKAPWVAHKINIEGLANNYLFQTTPSPETCFEGIYSIPPGHWMFINLNNAAIEYHRYWQIPVGIPSINITKEDATAQLDERLQYIVAHQLQSDVPVTSLMSGGIDSTTLTAICAKQHPDFHSYSLGFDGSGKGMDELPQAIAMAKKLDIVHHTHIIKPEEIIGSLEQSLQHYEEPYVSLEPGLVASAYLHNQGYKVVINGLGGDEVFGGYNYYLDYPKWQQQKKLFATRKLIPAFGDFLSRVKEYMHTDTVLKYFAHARLGMRYNEIKSLLKQEITDKQLYKESAGVEALPVPEALFYYDLKYYIGAHHVYRDDLTGMRHGLEMRYPLLDHELIEWVASLPMNIRHNGVTNKPLLREVAAKYITTENLSMPKKGFDLPLQQWLQQSTEIEDYAREKLKSLKKREIFNNEHIDKWWDLRLHNIYFSKVWQLVTTEVWLQTYID